MKQVTQQNKRCNKFIKGVDRNRDEKMRTRVSIIYVMILDNIIRKMLKC